MRPPEGRKEALTAMRIQFCGAAGEVTGSKHLLEVNGRRILLDCGLFQGRRKEAFEKNRRFLFDPPSVHSLVLSHAHIDHSGGIPRLTRDGFTGPIFSTLATQDLCGFMLRDSAHIQMTDVEHVNEKRLQLKQAPFEPLYTLTDAETSLKLFEGLPYHRRFEAAPGVEVEFHDAGHILGSALVLLKLTEGGRTLRVAFTGDLGRPGMPILRDPEPIQEADVLICESTYGDRLHGEDGDLKDQLRQALEPVHRRRGKVLIPAFSVGRTQTVVYYLHQLLVAGQLPPCPIYVDSPLSANVTDVFRRHPECYDEETGEFLQKKLDPFGFERLTYVRSVEDSKALNSLAGPSITISASGMCESGRVLHHLKHIAPRPENLILLVGYMAENTLGRRIQDGAKTIKVYGDDYPLLAHVQTISGFSGHADRGELLRFLGSLGSPPRRTFLVHGESDQAEGLAGQLRSRGFPRVDAPKAGDQAEI
jgi:metallo-beta-lactamase family protein